MQIWVCPLDTVLFCICFCFLFVFFLCVFFISVCKLCFLRESVVNDWILGEIGGVVLDTNGPISTVFFFLSLCLSSHFSPLWIELKLKSRSSCYSFQSGTCNRTFRSCLIIDVWEDFWYNVCPLSLPFLEEKKKRYWYFSWICIRCALNHLSLFYFYVCGVVQRMYCTCIFLQCTYIVCVE